MIDSELVERIEKIEEEVKIMKKSLNKEIVKMGGRLSGAKFDKKDFEKAKSSLFEHA